MGVNRGIQGLSNQTANTLQYTFDTTVVTKSGKVNMMANAVLLRNRGTATVTVNGFELTTGQYFSPPANIGEMITKQLNVVFASTGTRFLDVVIKTYLNLPH